MSSSCLKVWLNHAACGCALCTSEKPFRLEWYKLSEPKGQEELMFCQSIFRKQIRRHVSADHLMTDTYGHVHPLQSESIIQPKIWVRFSDSTWDSIWRPLKKKYQKQPKPRMGSRKGWHFCFLTFPMTAYFNSCHYPEIPPLLPTEEHISRRDYEKLLFKGRVFLSDFQGYTHFTFNGKYIAPSLKKKKIIQFRTTT